MSESDLDRLLAGLAPRLAEESYVFCCVSGQSIADFAALEPLGGFVEAEGPTLILRLDRARTAGLSFDGVFRLISLGAWSSLTAVGLTAALASALSAADISANVVAGYHHDHLFVPDADAERAMQVLEQLSAHSASPARPRPTASANELYRRRFGIDPVHDLHANATLRGILSRASHRRFTADAVDPALMEGLLAAALSSPTKSDLQQVSVVRVTDRDKLRRIAAGDDKVGWIAAAPEFMVWCGDSRRIRRLAGWRGRPFANDHLDAFMNAAVDAGIVMQTFIIAAESVGLGCCPVSEIRDRVDLLADELSLPEHVFPVAGLCVGWPAEPGVVSMRLAPAVTVHENQYDDGDLLQQVRDYDARRETARPTPANAQRDVARFGICPDYGWSEHRTRQYARPMRADFGAFVRRQKFDLT